MNKKLLSTLSLVLALGFTVGVTACNKEKEPEPRDVNDFTTAKTDEEIYESLKAGAANSAAYTGAMTFVSTYASEEKEDDEVTYSSSSTSKNSFDPAAGKILYDYSRTSQDEGDEEASTSSSQQKVFASGDKTYMYMKQNYGTAQESYYELSATYLAYVNENYAEQMNYYASMLGSYLTADKLATMQSAYNTVYSESLTEEKKVNADATATASVSVKNTDGVLTITIETSIASKDVEGESTQSYEQKATTTITGKDGKLTRMDYTENEKVTTPAVGETPAKTEEYKLVRSYEFGYAFDQTTYDALTTTLPETVVAYPNSPSKNVYVVYDGMRLTNVYYELTDTLTAETLVNQFSSSATNAVSNILGEQENAVAIYSDEACTKEITASTSLDELKALEYVYIKAITPASGDALVCETESYNVDLSDAYKIVYASIIADEFNEEGYPYGEFDTYTVAEQSTYELVDTSDYAEYNMTVETYVNGTKTTATEVTLQAGKTYKIEYRITYTDKTMNVFAVRDM